MDNFVSLTLVPRSVAWSAIDRADAIESFEVVVVVEEDAAFVLPCRSSLMTLSFQEALAGANDDVDDHAGDCTVFVLSTASLMVVRFTGSCRVDVFLVVMAVGTGS